jgi:hypothetical protein
MRIRGRYMQKEIAYRFREGNSKAALPRRLCTSQLLSQKNPKQWCLGFTSCLKAPKPGGRGWRHERRRAGIRSDGGRG